MDEAKDKLTREELFKKLKGHAVFLSTKYGVKRIGLFGSFARGEQNKTSDVDLLVELKKPLGFKFFDLSDYLEKLVGRKLDILTHEGLRGIRIGKTAENIKKEIIYV